MLLGIQVLRLIFLELFFFYPKITQDWMKRCREKKLAQYYFLE